VYHSSYLGGEAVLCAGEKSRIENGVVREINNDSGHYRPSAGKSKMAVELLVMAGSQPGSAAGVGAWHNGRSGDVPADPESQDIFRPIGLPGNATIAAQVSSTLAQNQKAHDRAKAFAKFRAYCRKGGVHSW